MESWHGALHEEPSTRRRAAAANQVSTPLPNCGRCTVSVRLWFLYSQATHLLVVLGMCIRVLELESFLLASGFSPLATTAIVERALMTTAASGALAGT